jgi:hypothetical protein
MAPDDDERLEETLGRLRDACKEAYGGLSKMSPFDRHSIGRALSDEASRPELPEPVQSVANELRQCLAALLIRRSWFTAHLHRALEKTYGSIDNTTRQDWEAVATVVRREESVERLPASLRFAAWKTRLHIDPLIWQQPELSTVWQRILPSRTRPRRHELTPEEAAECLVDEVFRITSDAEDEIAAAIRQAVSVSLDVSNVTIATEVGFAFLAVERTLLPLGDSQSDPKLIRAVYDCLHVRFKGDNSPLDDRAVRTLVDTYSHNFEIYRARHTADPGLAIYDLAADLIDRLQNRPVDWQYRHTERPQPNPMAAAGIVSLFSHAFPLDVAKQLKAKYRIVSI